MQTKSVVAIWSKLKNFEPRETIFQSDDNAVFLVLLSGYMEIAQPPAKGVVTFVIPNGIEPVSYH